MTLNTSIYVSLLFLGLQNVDDYGEKVTHLLRFLGFELDENRTKAGSPWHMLYESQNDYISFSIGLDYWRIQSL